MTVEPGDEVHYVALLDSELRTVHVMPLSVPIRVPSDDSVESVSADIDVRLSMSLKGRAA